MKTNFPELTIEQNKIIDKAREQGYSAFYPCIPDGITQAKNTLKGSILFLAELDVAKKKALGWTQQDFAEALKEVLKLY